MDHKDHISPEETFINGLPKENPFTVQDEYFNELPQSILLRLKEQETERPELPADPGYEIPEKYFDMLSANIMAKTTTIEQPKGKVIWLKRYEKIAVAAMVLLAFGLVLWLSKSKTDSGPALVNLEQVSEEDIYTYLENNNVSIDLVAEAYAETVSVKNPGESATGDSNALMEQYILENADEQLILEEL